MPGLKAMRASVHHGLSFSVPCSRMEFISSPVIIITLVFEVKQSLIVGIILLNITMVIISLHLCYSLLTIFFLYCELNVAVAGSGGRTV
jgi:hypothetical protein